ncbi:helix-turn-helix domain-containing protein [Loigolactobacillus bifermentans]|uniref:helix-turn-helix domain-containing protein n=1 Tax=Loigolactobacillus bifermentans TaxID=1607 RepID=UPI0009F8B93B|nr:helix-turn-helix domain-containing protein [Loigolactobacillus bifermentans]QGG61432.1 transposase [Loigolactobacillus bifermentans]
MIRTHRIKLLPNAKVRHVLDNNFGYSRYCYNQALEIWNVLYESHLITEDKTFRPNHYKVRNALVGEKEDWQYCYSARILQQVCFNLNCAWQSFFNPNMPHARKPKFKSKRSSRQSFTTDRAKVIGKYLKLDQPYQANYDKIRMTEPLRFTGIIKTTTITKRGDQYHASIAVEVPDNDFYPATQRCSSCGTIKTKDCYGGKQTLSGDLIHRQHQTYYCYNCGTVSDRDKNAVENLIQYAAGLSAVTV